jgi:hypothetical protein
MNPDAQFKQVAMVQNAMDWHTFLDMLEATLRGEPAEPRQAYMQRNAARYGVDLSNLAR